MEDKRPLIIGLNSALMALSTITIATRLLTRRFIIKHIGPDDVLILIAFILALTVSSLYILSARYGEGLHIQYLQPANVPAYTQVILLTGFFYGLCQMFIKLSYLAFYLRIAPDSVYRAILYVSIAFVTAFGISTSISYLYFLFPFCGVYIRIGLAGVFALGLIVLVASVARLEALVNLLSVPAYKSDNTWDSVDSMIWSSVEIHLGLLLSCTAAFKALIQKYLPGFLGSTRSARHTHSQIGFSTSTHGGRYVLQSRNPNEPDFKTATRASVTEVDKTGSQEHIIDVLEMDAFETTNSIHSASKASTDGGAFGGHSIAVAVST
ncbi:uncharacterized protein PAC_12685 [Phialocephala subalpina]|uniref:Rhodopsin domain-containing protein n=1 Tax=Phialocephala subalpina TaxID=576137 RepID=A0A1L7XCP4_9HELO|nr:uncharacterized protein PAC_12685 [Phialocephala subalpina]